MTLVDYREKLFANTMKMNPDKERIRSVSLFFLLLVIPFLMFGHYLNVHIHRTDVDHNNTKISSVWIRINDRFSRVENIVVVDKKIYKISKLNN